MSFLSVAFGAAVGAGLHAPPLAQAEGGSALNINLFWIILSSGNFIVLLLLLYVFAFRPLTKMLDERRAKIEQGLKDAEEAAKQREQASEEHR